MNRYEYTVIDTTCKGIKKEFVSPSEAVSWLRIHWIDFVVKNPSKEDICITHVSLADCNNRIIANVHVKTGFLEVV